MEQPFKVISPSRLAWESFPAWKLYKQSDKNCRDKTVVEILTF